VAILSQAYFINVADGVKYSSVGTNWEEFYKKTLSLIVGNEVEIKYKKDEEMKQITVKPAKLLIIEGSHIFMSN
jgi:uridine kinase